MNSLYQKKEFSVQFYLKEVRETSAKVIYNRTSLPRDFWYQLLHQATIWVYLPYTDEPKKKIKINI